MVGSDWTIIWLLSHLESGRERFRAMQTRKIFAFARTVRCTVRCAATAVVAVVAVVTVGFPQYGGSVQEQYGRLVGGNRLIRSGL